MMLRYTTRKTISLVTPSSSLSRKIINYTPSISQANTRTFFWSKNKDNNNNSFLFSKNNPSNSNSDDNNNNFNDNNNNNNNDDDNGDNSNKKRGTFITKGDNEDTILSGANELIIPDRSNAVERQPIGKYF